jgi:predicted MFS family arabinose efflux permease
VPAYVLAAREYYPASEANWRVPVLLLMSGSGMAAGSWLAGVMYDHYGYYAPAFAAGIGANMLNFVIIAALVARQQWTTGMPRRVGHISSATQHASS